MIHISQQLHDTIFAVGAFVLLLALIPAVIRKSVFPLSTCYITGGVLLVFALNYMSMDYWYATIVEAGNVVCWAYLYNLAWKARPHAIRQTI